MPNYTAVLNDFVAGDNLEIERTVTSIPSGQILQTAWLTIKKNYSHTDDLAVIQKTITSTLVSGTGQIEDTGVDGTGLLRFYLTSGETALLTPLSEYFYDIQVRLNSNNTYTPELGIIVAKQQVTRS